MARFICWLYDSYFRHIFFSLTSSVKCTFMNKTITFHQILFLSCVIVPVSVTDINNISWCCTLIFMFVPFECILIDDMNMYSACDWVCIIVLYDKNIDLYTLRIPCTACSLSLFMSCVACFFDNVSQLCYLYRVFCTSVAIDGVILGRIIFPSFTKSITTVTSEFTFLKLCIKSYHIEMIFFSWTILYISTKHQPKKFTYSHVHSQTSYYFVSTQMLWLLKRKYLGNLAKCWSHTCQPFHVNYNFILFSNPHLRFESVFN